ncbi:MAG: hypothetical protein RJA70_2470 [Pseudomonadota bacterium]|jgi:DNA polymerase-3 subunit gamma/tau
MSYVVLARKWRPQTFSDLVGQGHVSQTLGNAIANNRVAHAFLFTGVRGVGKTTSARILAKALNCMSSEGPTATPCLTCSACKEITDGRDVDVQEIDGASYTGVDEVRRLQESLPYRPSRDRYKIYIVDEVHMLSNNAWNAFLKTLEEPPPHVKFIFATTEVHKVPVTILSRVQRFDFKLIPTKLIIDRLAYVLAQDNIPADNAALAIIAREAAGSMRDAMSLLDQVIAWSDKGLSGEDVARVLGVASRQAVFDLAQGLIQGEPEVTLTVVSELANQGFEMANLARDLLGLLRDIVVAATCRNPSELLDLPDEELERATTLARHDVDDLLRLHQGFSQGYDDVVGSSQPRAALEMLLVRLARRPPLVPIDDLIARLIGLEKRISSASRAGSPPPGPASRSRPPAQGIPPGPTSGPASSTTTSPSSKAPLAARSSPAGGPPSPASKPAPAPSTSVRRSAEPEKNAVAVPEPSGSALGESAAQTGEPPSRLTPQTAVSASRESSGALEPTTHRLAQSEFDQLAELDRWRALVDVVRAGDAKLAAFLDHARIVTVSREQIVVSYEQASFFHAALDPAETRAQLGRAASQLLGCSPVVELRANVEGAAVQTVFDQDRQAREDKRLTAIEQAKQHPVVQEAVRVFGARIKAIELPEA